jgi:disulfide bond formation protein DsbB
MQKLIDTPRLVPALIVAVCLGTLATAFASEIWGGLKPCILCIYQRWAYGAAGFGLLGVILGASLVLRRLMVALAGLSFLAGAGIAFFHVGVEQLWWRGTDACHAPSFDPDLSLEQLREAMLATDFVSCDVIPLASLWVVTRMGRGATA